MNILITAGGTSEKIDAVRVISNISTGRTGAYLADYFAKNGANVTLLRAESAIEATHPNVKTVTYTSTESFSNALRRVVTDEYFDTILHSAAVSDYTVAAIRANGKRLSPNSTIKLPTSDSIELVLVKNPKLINTIKGWSKNPAVCLVAFKLTQAAAEMDIRAGVRHILRESQADYVLHNELTAMEGGRHPFRLFTWEGEIASGRTKQEMAAILYKITGEYHAACA